MRRTLKVGDIVNAKSRFNEATEKPVTKIGQPLYMVDGIWWKLDQLTLVQPIAAKPYKDQFTKWKPGHLVAIGAETINKLSDLEIDAMSIGNCAIRRMMEQQT